MEPLILLFWIWSNSIQARMDLSSSHLLAGDGPVWQSMQKADTKQDNFANTLPFISYPLHSTFVELRTKNEILQLLNQPEDNSSKVHVEQAKRIIVVPMGNFIMMKSIFHPGRIFIFSSSVSDRKIDT